MKGSPVCLEPIRKQRKRLFWQHSWRGCRPVRQHSYEVGSGRTRKNACTAPSHPVARPVAVRGHTFGGTRIFSLVWDFKKQTNSVHLEARFASQWQQKLRRAYMRSSAKATSKVFCRTDASTAPSRPALVCMHAHRGIGHESSTLHVTPTYPFCTLACVRTRCCNRNTCIRMMQA